MRARVIAQQGEHVLDKRREIDDLTARFRNATQTHQAFGDAQATVDFSIDSRDEFERLVARIEPQVALDGVQSEKDRSERIVDFLREARGQYQHIIVDSPPVLGVSDSLVLLPNMDGVLFVVRYGVTHSLGANHSILKLKDSGTPCIGAIMNGVNLNSVANYYYYRRYGGYAYRHYHTAPDGADSRVEG